MVALVAGALLLGPGNAAAADSGPITEIGEVEVLLHSAKDRLHHLLYLHVYSQQGVALAFTQQDASSEESAIAYAVAIPRGPFGGSIDLAFPGLGRFVGDVTSGAPLRGCGNRQGSGRIASFSGKIRFHGADDRRWRAKSAIAVEIPICGTQTFLGRGADRLLGAVGRSGPLIFGPNLIRFEARSLTRGHELEFLTVAADRNYRASFVAVDREWLPHRVATERWVKRSILEPTGLFSINEQPTRPTSAIFTPPAPFFGTGTYLQITQELSGSLGARFPGLTLRLTRPPMQATLVDEERP